MHNVAVFGERSWASMKFWLIWQVSSVGVNSRRKAAHNDEITNGDGTGARVLK